MTTRVTSILTSILFAIGLSACGPTANPVAAPPSPSLDANDMELLAQLKSIDFQAYDTDVTIGNYVFGGAGLNYDRNTLQLAYGGLAIDEWKAVNFNPGSGKCSTADPAFSWNCSFLAGSPKGHMLYAGPSGGLPGYPADLGDVYVELGSTVVHLQRGGLHTPSLADLELFADALKPATPDAVVGLNIRARAYSLYLDQTVVSRINFKTYLPQKAVEDFVLDRKTLGNPTDPLHPYLVLHFSRAATGNVALEFWVDEFRDVVPLGVEHCGVTNPEIGSLGAPCVLSFTTPKGVAVYSTYSETRFDIWPTRIVLWLSLTIDKLTQQQMTDFIDSFTEVAPKDIA